MTCIGTWGTSETLEQETSTASFKSSNKSLSTLSEKSKNTTQVDFSSGILALRDQKGFGECLEYHKSGDRIQIESGACGEKPKISNNNNFEVLFKGSCQEALMDAHAVSQGNDFKSVILPNFYYWMLTVMFKAVVNV